MEEWAPQVGALIGLTTVLVGLIRALTTGVLTSGRSVDRLEARYQAEVTALRELAELRRKEADQLRSQLDRVLATNDVTDRLMTTLKARAQAQDGSS